MSIKKIQFKNSEKGAVMMTSVIFFIVISVVVVLGLTGPAVREYRVAADSILSKQSYFLAESGVEDSYYRVKNHYTVSSVETLVLGSSSATTTLNYLAGGDVDVSGVGNVSTKQRLVSLRISGSAGNTFTYAAQAGAGGLDLSSATSIVNGNITSNGPITGAYNSVINGIAVSASSPDLAVNQSNGSGTPPYDITFGDTTSSRDISQSFQLNQSSPLNKISFYIKKNGSPADATLTIYRNAGGVPDTIAIASSVLTATSVSSSYDWVEVPFSQKVTLSTGVTYWMVLTLPGTSSSDTYTIGATSGGYTNGMAKIGQTGTVWNDPISGGGDYFFQIYLGGVPGLIQGSTGGIFIGLASTDYVQANSIGNVNVNGSIYCTNNLGGIEDYTGVTDVACTSASDVISSAYPISDTTIAGWESDAAAGTVTTGDFSVNGLGATVGPRKIIGNVTVNTTLTVSGTLWITGNLTFGSGGKIKLSGSYGASSGVVVVNGKITFPSGSSGYARGSGTSGSYIVLVSKSNSIDTSSPAILSGNTASDDAVLFAPYGLILLTSAGDSPAQVSAYQITVGNNAHINYSSGLSTLSILSGTGGSTASIPTISSWGETQ